MHSPRGERCGIYLKNILLALFHFVLQFLKLFRVQGWVHFAVAFSRYRQLLLFARRVVGFLCCFYLRGGGVAEPRDSERSKSSPDATEPLGSARALKRRGKRR